MKRESERRSLNLRRAAGSGDELALLWRGRRKALSDGPNPASPQRSSMSRVSPSPPLLSPRAALASRDVS
eukprot:3776253-Pleurochrysis_carterae.AAC.4